MKNIPRSQTLAHVLLTGIMCVTSSQSATVTTLDHPTPIEPADKNRDVLSTLAVSAPSVVGDLLNQHASHKFSVSGTYSETQWKFSLTGEYGGAPVDLMFAGMFDDEAASGSFSSLGTVGSMTWSAGGAYVYGDDALSNLLWSAMLDGLGNAGRMQLGAPAFTEGSPGTAAVRRTSFARVGAFGPGVDVETKNDGLLPTRSSDAAERDRDRKEEDDDKKEEDDDRTNPNLSEERKAERARKRAERAEERQRKEEERRRRQEERRREREERRRYDYGDDDDGFIPGRSSTGAFRVDNGSLIGSVESVPEPATMLLIGAGLVVIAVRSRRRVAQ